MDALVKSWKTSVAGVAVLAVTAAFVMKQIDVQTYMAVVGVLAGGGFLAAKDGGK